MRIQSSQLAIRLLKTKLHYKKSTLSLLKFKIFSSHIILIQEEKNTSEGIEKELICTVKSA